MNKKRLKISWVEKKKKMRKKTEKSDEEISELPLLNQSFGKYFLQQAYPTNLKISSSSDSSYGDDISIYDSSSSSSEEEEEEEEEDSETSDEEEDSEKSDEEKTPTLDLDSSRKEVRNRLQMPPDDDDDSEMYDLSEEEESPSPPPPPPPPPRCRSKKRKNRTPDSDEEKTPTPDLGSSLKEVRNWLEMPPDVMSLIFTKVGPIDILLGAQSVCTAWQKLSKEPHLYRSIDLRNRPDLYDKRNIRFDPVRLTICAVNRSAGQLVEFSLKYIATNAMLRSITKIRSPLKCLRLVECDNIYDHDVMLMAKKLPLLEELEMLHCYCCKSMIRGFGRYCPQLKSFRLTCTSERFCEKSNGQAFSIAQNMPGLHHLDLFGNPLSDTGLIAILDQCVNLKSLDCRRCFRLTFGEDLFKRCTDRNIDVKLPNDCTVGCGFDTSECDREFTMDGLPLTG